MTRKPKALFGNIGDPEMHSPFSLGANPAGAVANHETGGCNHMRFVTSVLFVFA